MPLLMKKKIVHYAVFNKNWYSACQLSDWSFKNMTVTKSKVTCKRCRKTKAFRGL